MASIFFICLTLLIAIGLESTAMFSSSMTHLTQRTFQSKVMDTEKTTLVMYYSPQCGHCRNMKPAYEKAAKSLNGIGQVVAVNCADEQQLCAESYIKGYPTVKGYYTNPKSRKRITVEYTGDRSSQSLVSFVHDKLPSFVKHIRPDTIMDLDKFYSIENTTIPKVIVVKPPTKSNIGKPSPLLRALAIDYHYRLLFGELSGKSDSDPIYSQINVMPDADNKPTVLVIQPNTNTVVKYSGLFKKDMLVKFFDQYALTKKLVVDKKKNKKEKEGEDNKRDKKEDIGDTKTGDQSRVEL